MVSKSIDKDHAKFLSKYYNDLVTLTDYLSSKKRKYKTQEYQDKLKDYLSYYHFFNDVITCDLLLEKRQVIENIEITSDQLIALARAGILVIERKM